MERVQYDEVEGLIKLVVVIGVWDTIRWWRGQPTFSNQVGAMLVHPNRRRKCLCVWCWVVLTHHLFCNLLPRRLRRTWGFPRRP